MLLTPCHPKHRPAGSDTLRVTSSIRSACDEAAGGGYPYLLGRLFHVAPVTLEQAVEIAFGGFFNRSGPALKAAQIRAGCHLLRDTDNGIVVATIIMLSLFTVRVLSDRSGAMPYLHRSFFSPILLVVRARFPMVCRMNKRAC